MVKKFRVLIAAGGVIMAMAIAVPVSAQKQGGILREYMIDSPASMSIHEEATPVATRPVMVGFLYVIAFGPGGLGLRSARGSDAAPRHV